METESRRALAGGWWEEGVGSYCFIAIKCQSFEMEGFCRRLVLMIARQYECT